MTLEVFSNLGDPMILWFISSVITKGFFVSSIQPNKEIYFDFFPYKIAMRFPTYSQMHL